MHQFAGAAGAGGRAGRRFAPPSAGFGAGLTNRIRAFAFINTIAGLIDLVFSGHGHLYTIATQVAFADALGLVFVMVWGGRWFREI